LANDAHRFDKQSRGRVMGVVSGWLREEDRKRSRAAGCDAHAVTPREYSALLEPMARTPSLRR
jgi:hypothetical protein